MTEIRKLAGDEIYDALNLVREVFFAEGNLGYPREGAKAFLEFVSARGELLSWLGAYDGTLVGALGYTDDFHLALLFVRKDLQKSGIGKRLFEEMKKEARACAV